MSDIGFLPVIILKQADVSRIVGKSRVETYMRGLLFIFCDSILVAVRLGVSALD